MIVALRPALLGFIVVTRAALAFGVALLVADRIPQPRRRAIGLTLIAVGAATTIPAEKTVWGRRVPVRGRVPVGELKTGS